jgi:hypothetical protein
MDIPAPKPGQVLRYAYLWADEHADGREEGTKDRPVALVLNIQTTGPHAKVAVVAITHAAPTSDQDAIEIPAVIKRNLGLDDARSWVVLTELNVFVWPGPDLRPAGALSADSVLYGYLPAGFFTTIRNRLAANIRAGRVRQVGRTE